MRSSNRLALGKNAEALVEAHLHTLGFATLARNLHVGRAELDLVMQKGSLLVVCEVRSRTDSRFFAPVETITSKKIARIRQATAQWLHQSNTRYTTIRFDAASVYFEPNGPRIEYYENAF